MDATLFKFSVFCLNFVTRATKVGRNEIFWPWCNDFGDISYNLDIAYFLLNSTKSITIVTWCILDNKNNTNIFSEWKERVDIQNFT